MCPTAPNHPAQTRIFPGTMERVSIWGRSFPNLPPSHWRETSLFRTGVGAAVFLLPGLNALAADPPNAGAQIQQIPAPTVPETRIPEVRIEQGSTPATPAADQAKIMVKSLHVTGQTL